MAPASTSSSVDSAARAASLIDRIRALATIGTVSQVTFRVGLPVSEVSRLCLAHGITFVKVPADPVTFASLALEPCAPAANKERPPWRKQFARTWCILGKIR